MNTLAIEAIGLRKQYGDTIAVDGLDLKVEKGGIFGLVGADGAGKTTSIQMLCTLNLPTAGKAMVLGMDTVKQSEDIKKKIGYMSERFNLYPTLTVDENLDFFVRLRNIPHAVADQRKKELINFCRLEPFRNRLADHLSGGMQKKLALACSLIHEPEVLFLDEPSTGVDPVSRQDFWHIITSFVSRGITVLVSTPYLDEAERFNMVAFMHHGKIIACDSPQNLRNTLTGKTLEIKGSPLNSLIAALKENPFFYHLHIFGDTIRIALDDAEKRIPEIQHLLVSKGVITEYIKPVSPGLEEVFISRLTGLEEKQSPNSSVDFQTSESKQNEHIDESSIEVSDLTRKFGGFTAVNSVSFKVKRGEIFVFRPQWVKEKLQPYA